MHPKSTPDLSEWLAQNDHFFVDFPASWFPPTSLTELRPLPARQLLRCDVCIEERVQTLAEEDVIISDEPLRCLELYAGAGGLATGLHKSGAIEMKWAVECSPSAAATYA